MSSDPLVSRLRAAGCVFAEEEAALLRAAAGTADELDELAARRVAGFPLEQILGWAEFAGLRVAVAPGVFVPRRRTELLVDQATALAPLSALVVDLCCGTGAIGLAIATRLTATRLTATRLEKATLHDNATLHAADIDPAAVDCARRNLGPVGGLVHEGDLYRALPPTLRGRVDILVANAPYVPTAEVAWMPPEARDHEHLVALDGGDDGLDLVRRIAADAVAWLAPGGHLLIETSVEQAAEVAEVFAHSGLTPRTVHDDDLDATAVVGSR